MAYNTEYMNENARDELENKLYTLIEAIKDESGEVDPERFMLKLANAIEYLIDQKIAEALQKFSANFRTGGPTTPYTP